MKSEETVGRRVFKFINEGTYDPLAHPEEESIILDTIEIMFVILLYAFNWLALRHQSLFRALFSLILS